MTLAPPYVRVTRSVGPSSADLVATEGVEIAMRGGADTVSVGANLTGVAGVGVDLGAGADTLNTMASSSVTANGNTEFDTLNFDAQHQIVSTTPSTMAVGGVTRVTYANF